MAGIAALPSQEQEVLEAARNHDIARLRPLLRTTSASVRDPTTGLTPLHEAILGAVSDRRGAELRKPSLPPAQLQATENVSHGQEDEVTTSPQLAKAEATMRLLLEKGAIWNDLDCKNETPGCLALRVGLRELYEIMVDAGVRAEMLLNRLDEYEALSDGEGDVESAGADESKPAEGVLGADAEANGQGKDEASAPREQQVDSNSTLEADLQNNNYLRSTLRYQDDRLLDDSDNGVMMEWESQLMQRHADLLCPEQGLRVLNIGFGMGKSKTLRPPTLSHIYNQGSTMYMAKKHQASSTPSSKPNHLPPTI